LQRREADMAKMEKHTREISRVESMPLYSTVKNFRGPDAELKAYQFGMWALGVLGNDTTRFISNFTKRAIAYCENWGLNTKAQGEAVDTGGGYLVPTYFLNDLIQLREEFGVFRRTTQVVPMTSEVMIVPRRAGGLTVYYPAEGIATTESQKIWDGVSLTARKYACLILYSSELNEDAIVSVGDDLAGELAYAFAVAEDNNAFNGDGTSTFAGTNGVRNRLFSIYGAAGGVGLRLATGSGSGNNWGTGIVHADLRAVAASLPLYARGRARWFCSGIFAETVLMAQSLSSASPVVVDIANGINPVFLGFPVEICQNMPVTAALSQVPVFLGDLRLAAKLGETRDVSIAIADQYKFAEDQFAIRGTQRIDIVVHDAGNASQAGPVVGLVTKAS